MRRRAVLAGLAWGAAPALAAAQAASDAPVAGHAHATPPSATTTTAAPVHRAVTQHHTAHPAPAASAAPQPVTIMLEPIVPANALEQTFINASRNDSLRPAFRRALLEADVVVATTGHTGEIRPLLVPLEGNVRGVPIFTSPQRLAQVLGQNAPGQTLTGREALTRLRHQYVVINYTLMPMLTLEPADVQHFLEITTEPSQ
ncbi:MAG: SseB family protein [Pseudomonadota bacterium]